VDVLSLLRPALRASARERVLRVMPHYCGQFALIAAYTVFVLATQWPVPGAGMPSGIQSGSLMSEP